MISSGGRSKLELRRSWIILHLQLELKRDLRCRLAVPFVYVPRYYISWHWDPDALARWYTLMSYLVSFLRVAPPQQKLLLKDRTGAGNSGGKARSRLKEWIMWCIDYYRAEPQQVKLLWKSKWLGFYFRIILKDNCCISI